MCFFFVRDKASEVRVAVSDVVWQTARVDIEPAVSLAFTIEANPGSYALLLGAGVSRGAVPTAWDVLIELVSRLATVRGADAVDPMAWYEETYGGPPNYSDVLEALSPTPAGRVGLLRPFFEDGTLKVEDLEEGSPQPTEAHVAIANLMKSGFIKVVITTNFDRLLEHALNAIGVAPTVLTTPSAIAGALPLHQQSACIIKIHGDYLDPTFLNTGDELNEYDPAVREILARVLDDYGLVICGWSAVWDSALRHELEEHNPRRYANYWVEPSDLREEANRLAQHRNATVVQSTSSDFFVDLEQAVSSLSRANRAHPISVAVGVATAKRYITSGNMVELHDLMAREFRQVEMNVEIDPMTGRSESQFEELTRQVDGELLKVVALIGTLARWGDTSTDDIWVPALLEMANQSPVGGDTRALDLRYYPASLVLYSAGVALICGGRRRDLERLLRRSVLIATSNKPGPLSSELCAHRSLSYLRSESKSSGHVLEVVAPVISEQLLLSKETVRRAFDELELMMALTSFDAQSNPLLWVRYASYGIIRREGNYLSGRARPVVELEAAAIDGVHPWIAEGLFEGSSERLQAALDSFTPIYATRSMYPGT